MDQFFDGGNLSFVGLALLALPFAAYGTVGGVRSVGAMMAASRVGGGSPPLVVAEAAALGVTSLLPAVVQHVLGLRLQDPPAIYLYAALGRPIFALARANDLRGRGERA